MAGKPGKFERNANRLYRFLVEQSANFQYVRLTNEELGEVLGCSRASIRNHLRALKLAGKVFVSVTRHPIQTPEGKVWVNKRLITTNKEF